MTTPAPAQQNRAPLGSCHVNTYCQRHSEPRQVTLCFPNLHKCSCRVWYCPVGYVVRQTFSKGSKEKVDKVL